MNITKALNRLIGNLSITITGTCCGVALGILILASLNSCSGNHSTDYVVTVCKKHSGTMVGTVTGSLSSMPLYDAVTSSGDTVTVHVPERIQLKVQVPYKARMEKSTTARYGVITRTIGGNN